MERMLLSKRLQMSQKILATCPICKKRIYGRDLKLESLNLEQIRSYPFSVTFCHKNSKETISNKLDSNLDQKPSLHAVTMYLDADFKVRGLESSEFLLFEN